MIAILRRCVPNNKHDPSGATVFAKAWKRYCSTRSSPHSDAKRDVIVVGGGHNGLIAAAYLAKAGKRVTVLERRHLVGGASVTEELYPGFKYSRAAYLAGLLRPKIIEELGLKKRGLRYISRDPSSFTPTLMDSKYAGKSLVLGSDDEANWKSIAQFSERDADAYVKYEAFLGQVRDILQPLLDAAPPSLDPMRHSLQETAYNVSTLSRLVRVGFKHREVLVPFYELFVGPATQLLDRWFDSDILKATLATDAVIGALVSPSQPGSAYVLLHHVMGETDGRKGVWAYVEGGMGRVSDAIADAAREYGAEIFTDATVSRILTTEGSGSGSGSASWSGWSGTDGKGRRVTGVEMADGSRLFADVVVAGCAPHHALLDLLDSPSSAGALPPPLVRHLRHTDFTCGSFKINCAVDRLPSFVCCPSSVCTSTGIVLPGPMHHGTIHLNSTMDEIEAAYREAIQGKPATRPVIEMTIPSALDPSVAPVALGHHVVQLFVQYAPYHLQNGSWEDPACTAAFADRVFDIVDDFCPGFSSSVLHRDVLSPLDLERVFGLPGGSISHGALSLNQLAYSRPAPGIADYRTPVHGLYMCSAGTHPGGGVIGAPGRNCARSVLFDVA